MGQYDSLSSERAWLARLLPKGICARLFLLIGLTLLPVLLLLGWIYHQRYQTRRAQALATELEVAQGVATTFQAYLDDLRRQNHAVGQAILTFDPYTEAKALRVLKEAAGQHPTVRNLSWVSPAGSVLVSTLPALVGRDLSHRPCFQQVLDGQPFAIGDLTSSGTVNNVPTVGFATAIRDEFGELRGVVVAGIEPTRLGELTLTQRRPAGGAYAIFDRQGVVVYRSQETPFTWEQRVAWRESDTVLQRALATGQAQVGITQLPATEGDWISALAPVRSALLQDSALALLVFALAFGMAFLVARTIAQPLQGLEYDAQEMGASQIKTHHDDPLVPTEIRRLRETVTGMAARLIERAEAQKRSRALLSEAEKLSHTGAWEWDMITDEWTFSDEWLAIHGCAHRTLNPDELLAIAHPDDLVVIERAFEDVRRGVRPYEMEHRIVRQDTGEVRIVKARGQYVHDPAGRVMKVYGFAQDITEQKRAEEARRESEERFRAFFENIAVGTAQLDMDGRFMQVNDRYCQITGYSREELVVGMTPVDLAHPDDRQYDRDYLMHYLRGQSSSYAIEKRFIRKDGQEIWVRVTGGLIHDADGKPMRMAGVVEDITDRKRAEEALRESEAMLRAVVEQLPSGVTVRDARTGALILSNTRSREIMGDLVAVPGEFARYRGFHDDGRPYQIAEWPLFRSMATGEVVDAEAVEYERGDGSRVTLSISSAPVRDEEGQILEGVAVFHDITERKRAEEALIEADRRKDEFLAMLAHELRNPLAPVRNAVQVLRLTSPSDSTTQRQKDVIDRQVTHMVRLVDDLLDVSRITRGKIALQKEQVVVCEIVARALETVQPLIESRRHRLHVTMPERPLHVEADPVRLAQVVANLLNNAAKYTDEGGQIWLKVERNGQQAVIRVRDTGAGIRPEVLSSLFDLFTQAERSLDRAQGGLGIGLYLVRRLVEMHDGAVQAWSPGPGQGSEFTVALPLLFEARQEESMMARTLLHSDSAERSNVDTRENTHKILIVEDNVDSASSLAELLEIWGQQVRAVHDGPAAVETALAFLPDIVLLDIGLPGLNGYEVARRLRREPALEGATLVALTGYGQEEDRRKAEEAGFNRHFTKPVDLDALQSLLDRAA